MRLEAITRYNRSTFYATAVLDLADTIRAARTRQMVASAARVMQDPPQPSALTGDSLY